MNNRESKVYSFLVNNAVDSFKENGNLTQFYYKKYITYMDNHINYNRSYMGNKEYLQISVHYHETEEDDIDLNIFTFEQDVKKIIRLENIDNVLNSL